MSEQPAPSDETSPHFEIGLALSGAISAGAYTAGVIDFLMQALQAWEDERPDAPEHHVRIRTLAGASAGAITAALGVVALARDLRPTPLSEDEIRQSHREETVPYQTLRCVLPSLHRTWVARPQMVASQKGELDFLSLEDLAPEPGTAGKPVAVQSLLNSKLLDSIRDEAFAPPSGTGFAKPSYPYLAETMHVFITVSNLRGIPFEVAFGNSTYGMQTHGDRLHYAITGVGTVTWPKEAWLAAESPIPLDAGTLPRTTRATIDTWRDFGTCALASAAFPIGLAPRLISTPFATYQNRQYPVDVELGKIIPKFPPGGGETYKFLNVDGGVVNNNPFDYVQYAIMGRGSSVSTRGSSVDRAVIMVSPFPEPPTFLPEHRPVADVLFVIKALFAALINQARFRASELGPALDPNDASRYLIAPHRRLKPDRIERYALACGLFGGFGGFFHEAFRAHDYQLGRRNCQRFLQTVFCLPLDHPISIPMRGDPAVQIAPDTKRDLTDKCTILPLLGDARPEVPLPHWPQMPLASFEHLIERIGERLDKVAPALFASQTGNRPLRWIAWAGLKVQRGRILEFVRLTILADLVRRNQIEEWTLPDALIHWAEREPMPDGGEAYGSDNVRAIVAEFITPTFDYRTIPSIATATHLSPQFVRRTIKQLKAAGDDKPYRVVDAGRDGDQPLYVLATRRRPSYRSWPVIGRVADWLVAPRTDYS